MWTDSASAQTSRNFSRTLELADPPTCARCTLNTENGPDVELALHVDLSLIYSKHRTSKSFSSFSSFCFCSFVNILSLWMLAIQPSPKNKRPSSLTRKNKVGKINASCRTMKNCRLFTRNSLVSKVASGQKYHGYLHLMVAILCKMLI